MIHQKNPKRKKDNSIEWWVLRFFAPYGYVVDPENKRKLLVDPDTAPIVKRIFELSKQATAFIRLREPCARMMFYSESIQGNEERPLETSTGFKFPTDWVAKNVKMILENQVYLGHMVSHKTQTKSLRIRSRLQFRKKNGL